jgi:hypothetical protein
LNPVRHRQADCGRQVAIPALAEPWADTGISTGRFMFAVLDGLAGVGRATLSAPALSGAAAGRNGPGSNGPAAKINAVAEG